MVARALRDAGVEVIYTGLHQTPEQIVAAAIQEDVDAVGLSVLSGAHMTLFPRVIELLKENGADDIVVFGGGIIPDADIAELTAQGVAKIFTPGASTTDIVAWVNEDLAPRHAAIPWRHPVPRGRPPPRWQGLHHRSARTTVLASAAHGRPAICDQPVQRRLTGTGGLCIAAPASRLHAG